MNLRQKAKKYKQEMKRYKWLYGLKSIPYTIAQYDVQTLRTETIIKRDVLQQVDEKFVIDRLVNSFGDAIGKYLVTKQEYLPYIDAYKITADLKIVKPPY